MGIALHEREVGPLTTSGHRRGDELRLRMSDTSCVLLVLRKQGRDKCYQIQGVAIADTFDEAHKKARAICRDHTYFWIGPLPANAAFPHTAFKLEKHFPHKRPVKRAASKGQKGSGKLSPHHV